jgi:hypothetical protein
VNRLKFRAPIATVIAILAGWGILFTYILPLDNLRNTVLSWVVIAAAAALLVGVVNLLSVHLGRLRGGTGVSLYSFSLVFALIITFTVTLLQGPEKEFPQWLFTYVQIPVESSLMAVMAVTLTYAGARLLTRRTNAFSVIFGIALLLALLGAAPILSTEITFLREITQVLSGAGARGILLGIGLGTVATGLRILIGSDRPYGG